MDTPKFPHHRDCEALTGITLDHLPRDGSLGRVRRFAKGAYVWQPDDGADRIYFLRRGRVVVMTAKPHERRVLITDYTPLCAASGFLLRFPIGLGVMSALYSERDTVLRLALPGVSF